MSDAGPDDDQPTTLDPEVVRRVEHIADGALQQAGDERSPSTVELEEALAQLRADRTNGERLDESFVRLCEAIAAARVVQRG